MPIFVELPAPLLHLLLRFWHTHRQKRTHRETNIRAKTQWKRDPKTNAGGSWREESAVRHAGPPDAAHANVAPQCRGAQGRDTQEEGTGGRRTGGGRWERGLTVLIVPELTIQRQSVCAPHVMNEIIFTRARSVGSAGRPRAKKKSLESLQSFSRCRKKATNR